MLEKRTLLRWLIEKRGLGSLRSLKKAWKVEFLVARSNSINLRYFVDRISPSDTRISIIMEIIMIFLQSEIKVRTVNPKHRLVVRNGNILFVYE